MFHLPSIFKSPGGLNVSMHTGLDVRLAKNLNPPPLKQVECNSWRWKNHTLKSIYWGVQWFILIILYVASILISLILIIMYHLYVTLTPESFKLSIPTFSILVKNVKKWGLFSETGQLLIGWTRGVFEIIDQNMLRIPLTEILAYCLWAYFEKYFD